MAYQNGENNTINIKSVANWIACNMDSSQQPQLVATALTFLYFIQIASFSAIMMRKLSRSGVLHIASSNQRRTLELLRRGVGIIPVTEHKAYYDRYRRFVFQHSASLPLSGPYLTFTSMISLAEYTTLVADSRSFIVGHIRGVRQWLANVKKLRATVEAEFEKYEADSIGYILYEGPKVM
ncbi:hypothetical protein C8Q80DRAFT_1345860 [Daedaleopsis nitida]|nr:hypothetical protein C8Q80DRAFT_1345860 [Daedaleopsis nitida]